MLSLKEELRSCGYEGRLGAYLSESRTQEFVHSIDDHWKIAIKQRMLYGIDFEIVFLRDNRICCDANGNNAIIRCSLYGLVDFVSLTEEECRGACPDLAYGYEVYRAMLIKSGFLPSEGYAPKPSPVRAPIEKRFMAALSKSNSFTLRLDSCWEISVQRRESDIIFRFLRDKRYWRYDKGLGEPIEVAMPLKKGVDFFLATLEKTRKEIKNGLYESFGRLFCDLMQN